MQRLHLTPRTPFGPFPRLALWLAIALGALATFPASPPVLAQADAGGDASGTLETKELFRVSRVGRRGAAESRELLVALYTEIARDHDAEVAKTRPSEDPSFKGERVQVLRELDDPSRYLCVYQGNLAVFVMQGGKTLDAGHWSPPLLLQAGPEEAAKITRVVEIPAPGAKPPVPSTPALETLDGDDEEITFFGIPLVRTPPRQEAEPQFIEKEITESRILPGFAATVSDIPLQEGPPPMSQELFLGELKNGAIFTVGRSEMRRCQECRGFKRVQDTRKRGFRAPDGKMDCPECKAAGERRWQVTYKIVW